MTISQNDERNNRHALLNDNTEYENHSEERFGIFRIKYVNKIQENTERREHEKIIKNDAEKETGKENEKKQ